MKLSIQKKYADLIAKQGINVQKGQPVIISASVEAYSFVELLVKSCYRQGAKIVEVQWHDSVNQKSDYRYASTKTLSYVPSWLVDKMQERIDNNYARISLISSDPDALKGINADKMQKVNIAKSTHLRRFSEAYMASKIQWCVAAYPSYKWAKKVFPHLSKSKAFEALFMAILESSRVSVENDPIIEWENHDNSLLTKSQKLNQLNFKSLRYLSKNGTDFTVGLVKNHIWAGGAEECALGVKFNPNIPTEEVFTMPERHSAEGKVVSTKPLSYQGNLIESFYLIFKEGKVVECHAEKGEDILRSLVNTDAGSASLGEVALVPFHSPISQSNILFFNTLFDENASCHLALGNAYPMNVQGGTEMSKEELDAVGANSSIVHEDFMVGAEDLSIVGTTYDGQEIPVFVNGDWAI